MDLRAPDALRRRSVLLLAADLALVPAQAGDVLLGRQNSTAVITASSRPPALRRGEQVCEGAASAADSAAAEEKRVV